MPDPEILLRRLLNNTGSPFQGVVVMTHWSGAHTQSEEARIVVAGPQRYRCEFLTPAGQIQRVVVSNGGREMVYLPTRRRIFSGASIGAGPQPPRGDMDLLERNYEIRSVGTALVAGRPTWKVRLVPRAEGKPHQFLWIDQATGALLEIRRFLPDRPYAASVRYTEYVPAPQNQKQLFELTDADLPIPEEHGLSPQFRSFEEMGSEGQVPAELPYGFVFESGNRFTAQGHPVTQYCYTDGLALLSLFQTPVPVQMSPRSNVDEMGEGAPLTIPPQMVQGERKGAHFTLLGDSSPALLQAVWENMTPSPPAD